MKYRAEIDGLRAVAVLSVILFHADITGFSGGYIGVDVFFIISGYLITTIIINEKEKNTFSLVQFYINRARRILPLLYLVLIFSTIVAYIVLPPLYLYYFSQSLLSAISFLSNVYFYMKTGYFSPSSEQFPLLHTWSLAIEEQFYLIFPFLMITLWSLRKKIQFIILLSLGITSLIFSNYLISNNEIDMNFYLIFSRAWELLAGSIIALVLLNITITHSWRNDLFSFFGFSLILLSVFFFTKLTVSSTLFMLIPIIGTLMIIVYCDENTFIGKLLSTKFLVFIGLISFSLYLWHFPIFAFMKVTSTWNNSTLSVVLALIFTLVFTLVFSVFSYKYVEKLFRDRDVVSTRAFISVSLLSTLLLVSCGLWIYSNKGLSERYEESLFSSSIKSSPKRKECHASKNKYIPPNNACEYSGDKVSWAVMGDSHSVEIGYALSERIKANNSGVKHLSYSGCPPALQFKVKDSGCNKWINESVKHLENNESIKNIILAFRHTGYLYGSNQMNNYPLIESNESISHVYTEDFNRSLSVDPREVYWRSFLSIVNRLEIAGKTVFILYPIPELPQRITTLVRPVTIFSKKTSISLMNTTTASHYYNRNKYILNKLNTLKYTKKLRKIEPYNVYCSVDYCSAIKNGRALYFDDNHPSIYGAKLIAASIKI